MKILVVDDERDVAELFRQHFRRELRQGQVAFEFAYSGDEALQQLTGASGDDIVMIFTDINMPGMNGLDLLRTVKQRFAALRVFMVTAYGDSEKYRLAQEYGSDGYFTKPIDFASVKAQILG